MCCGLAYPKAVISLCPPTCLTEATFAPCPTKELLTKAVWLLLTGKLLILVLWNPEVLLSLFYSNSFIQQVIERQVLTHRFSVSPVDWRKCDILFLFLLWKFCDSFSWWWPCIAQDFSPLLLGKLSTAYCVSSSPVPLSFRSRVRHLHTTIRHYISNLTLYLLSSL